MLLLVVPGGEKAATIDAEGHLALGVMRALGLPETVLAVQGGVSSNNTAGKRDWLCKFGVSYHQMLYWTCLRRCWICRAGFPQTTQQIMEMV